MSTPEPDTRPEAASHSPFLAGMRTAYTSILVYVLLGTFVGVGALAHEFGFSLLWLTLSTLLIWAAPAQVILLTALATGSSLAETAIAVTLSAIRLFFMTVSLLPLLRTPATTKRSLLLTTHFVAISMWVESLRLLPEIPQEDRVPYCNGISTGFFSAAIVGGVIGFYLASRLPVALAAGLLFLTPLSFLLSVARNSGSMVERAAFVLGLIIAPVLFVMNVGLDLLWTGLLGGTIAYGGQRLRERMR